MLANILLALAAITPTTLAAVHKVSVGQDGLAFTPDTVQAAAGDVVEFRFVGGNHDAVTAEFERPCEPAAKDRGFSSGVQMGKPDADMAFKVTVNSTDPMLVYCSVREHCKNGMVMAINPTAERTAEVFRNMAKDKASKAPDGVYGGVWGPPSP